MTTYRNGHSTERLGKKPIWRRHGSCWGLVLALLSGVIGFAVSSPIVASKARAVEPYFCIELVLSRNWPAAQFYCDAAAMPDNTGVVLAEGIAYFFGAQDAGDVAHAGRLWRGLPPLADEGEWRNVAGVYDAEIDIVEREAATLNRLAQYKLGVLHETGHLTTADPPVAVFRYQQAANAGLPEAHIALARLFQHGIGVEADPVAAQQHLLAAIEARPALRLPARPAPSEAVADASSVEEPIGTAVSSGGSNTEGGILAAITGDDENTQSVVESNDTQTDDTQIAAIDPNMSEAELEALETSIVTGQLRRRTIVGDAAGQGTVDGDSNDVDVEPVGETTIAAAVPDDDASTSDGDRETDTGIGAGILAGLLGSGDSVNDDEIESDEQAVVQLWDTDSGVAIVPPEASAGAADVEGESETSGVSIQSDSAVADGETADTDSRWAPPAEVAALYYPKEPLEETSTDLAPTAPSSSASSGQTVGSGESVSVTTGRLDTRQVDDGPNFSCADTATGATMAMPVIREEGDLGDEPSEIDQQPGEPLSADQLASLEAGFRAKAAGDFDGALAAWEPLAVDGLPTAQYLVGLLYLTGDALPRNLRAAYAWFSLAGDRGHQLANCERLRLAERLSPDDIALANDLAGTLAPIP
ncbi:MAG: hypothetical protein AAF563_13615 [Pseudomonadota bacterium]